MFELPPNPDFREKSKNTLFGHINIPRRSVIYIFICSRVELGEEILFTPYIQTQTDIIYVTISFMFSNYIDTDQMNKISIIILIN